MNKLAYHRKIKGISQEELGKALNVHKANVSAWENGSRAIPLKHLPKIKKILGISEEEVLSMTIPAILQEKFSCSAEEKNITLQIQNPEVSAKVPDRGCAVPVITQAAAATVNPVFMPLLDCVKEHAEESIFFADAQEGDFCIEVAGESMMPWYPAGTFLLVRPYQDITNGKRVVAVLSTGEILFKVFLKKGNKIALLSIDGEKGSRFDFDLANPAPDQPTIRYICRVIASQRNEDKLDSAMQNAGIKHFWEEELKNL